jgi:uncharacterized membrane protein
MGVASALQQKVPLKYVICIGEVLVLVGTVLFPFADSRENFWHRAFPGFFVGTAGMTIVFATTKQVSRLILYKCCSNRAFTYSIALFAITPPEKAGVIGAIFTCALQLGSAAGAAIITSIQTSVQQHHGGPLGFQGRAAGFWFLFAFDAVIALCVLLFMKNTVPPMKANENKGDVGSGTSKMEVGTSKTPDTA